MYSGNESVAVAAGPCGSGPSGGRYAGRQYYRSARCYAGDQTRVGKRLPGEPGFANGNRLSNRWDTPLVDGAVDGYR